MTKAIMIILCLIYHHNLITSMSLLLDLVVFASVSSGGVKLEDAKDYADLYAF